MTDSSSAAILDELAGRRFKPSNADFLKVIVPESENEPFFQLGLPTGRLESWKYTNLLPALKKVATRVEDSGTSFSGETRFLSQPEAGDKRPKWLQSALSVTPPGRKDHGDTIIWRACEAMASGLYVIDVPEREKCDIPLRMILKGSKGGLHAPRIVVRLGAGAELTLTEEIEGSEPYWALPLLQLYLASGAKLSHSRVHVCPGEAVYTPVTHIVLEEDAEFHSVSLTAGGFISRSQFYASLEGERARVVVNGINLLTGAQSSEMNVTVRHAAENCYSMQTMRSVLNDRAKGAFQGAIIVDRLAQKTDAHQLSKALVLSEGAEMNTRPELEIYADDVKCSHGATTGDLDEESLFYLRSRGIPYEDARRLLIQAFVTELVEQTPDAAIREHCLEKVTAWLNR